MLSAICTLVQVAWCSWTVRIGGIWVRAGFKAHATNCAQIIGRGVIVLALKRMLRWCWVVVLGCANDAGLGVEATGVGEHAAGGRLCLLA